MITILTFGFGSVEQNPISKKELMKTVVQTVEKQNEINAKLDKLQERYDTAQNLLLQDEEEKCIQELSDLQEQANRLMDRQYMILNLAVNSNQKFKYN